MMSESEYASQCASINARYAEKLRQCQASFLALKIASTHDIGLNVPAGMQRMTHLNFKEDSEVLKIEFDREEEMRELQKRAGYTQTSTTTHRSATGHVNDAGSRAVAVGALAAIARGMLRPEDQMARQEIDYWVAKFEASNG